MEMKQMVINLSGTLKNMYLTEVINLIGDLPVGIIGSSEMSEHNIDLWLKEKMLSSTAQTPIPWPIPKVLISVILH